MIYQSHVWFGAVTAIAVIAISLTGIYLNHLSSLGFWVTPDHESEGTVEEALSIREMIILGLTAAHADGLNVDSPRDVARVTYRPGIGQVAVRFTDRRATEAVLDATTGEVLQVAPRDDVLLEHIHTGEVLGQRGVIVSDVVAGALVLLTIGGVALWLNRLSRARRNESSTPARRRWWIQLNRSVHTVAGLAVAVVVILLCVTGILLNHKRELGLMEEPFRPYDYEPQRRAPMAFKQLADIAIAAVGTPGLSVSDVRFIDFRPSMGYAKVRFKGERSREIIVDVYDGDVLNASSRKDFFFEELHAGAAFGEELGTTKGTLLVDLTGVLLIVLTVNGLYIWTWPVWSARSRAERAGTPLEDEEQDE